jgi:hypothetical protein
MAETSYDVLMRELLRVSPEEARSQRFFYVVVEQDISGTFKGVLVATRSQARVSDVVFKCREEADGYAVVLVADDATGETIRTTVGRLSDYPESETCVLPKLPDRLINRCFVITTVERMLRGFAVVHEPSMLRTISGAVSMHGPCVIDASPSALLPTSTLGPACMPSPTLMPTLMSAPAATLKPVAAVALPAKTSV